MVDVVCDEAVDDRENLVIMDIAVDSGTDGGADVAAAAGGGGTSLAGGSSSIRDTSSNDDVEILRWDRGDLRAAVLPLSARLVSRGDGKLALLLSITAGGSDIDDIVDSEARVKCLDRGGGEVVSRASLKVSSASYRSSSISRESFSCYT